MPKLSIDGKQLEVPEGETIIRAAKRVGISIPHYCWHPALPVAGNCRICMVEVEKQPKPQIACYTPVTDGMVVKTNSPKVLEVRRAVLEFLLVNHPLDCPVCDQAGECKLQDYYMDHGQYDSRLADMKVKKEKKAFAIGPTVMLDQERCILCTRCVRFTEHITHTHEFGVFNRGDHSVLDLYPGKKLDNNYSGNVVDICPVGALTDRDFRFKCRVWYLEKTRSICPGCSMGCNITVEWDKSRPHQFKHARVMRLKPRHNPDVNSYWMCDKGRYNYHFIDENRILEPQFKNDVMSWDKAIEVVADTIRPIIQANRADKIGVLASAQLTNEDLFLVRQLFKETGAQVDFRVPEKPGEGDEFLLKADRNPNTAGALKIIGTDVQAEEILKKARQGAFEVLYVFGADLVKLLGTEVVGEIAGKVKLFVYQGSNINETCLWAHLNLPSSVYAEKDGTLTNCQQKVQRLWPAFLPLGEAKADWEILSLISEKLGKPLGYKNSSAVFDALAKKVPGFAGMSYEKISDSGMVLS
ncbi:MAG: (2Fe-2S)-binding protein [Candidatus Omnitrophica bacterium]|nr:(2Fe-2S)-binding protein [Candidatus Omnitrophota bacterium]